LPPLQPRAIAQAVLKRSWVVLLVVLGLVGPTLAFSLFQPSVYEASVPMFVEPEWGRKWETGIPGIQLIPPTVSLPPEHIREAMEAIDKPAIAQETIRRLGLSGMDESELLDNLRLTQNGSLFFELSYKDTNPQRAQRIANAVAKVASEQVRKETPYDYVLRIRVWREATLPAIPVSPNPVRNAIVALGVGLMLGIGLALLLEQRSQT
jgi:capsular polysaccharide biosynthesis protein